MADQPSEEVARILSALERYEGTYPREALNAALAHRKEITPHLIAILEQVRDDPQRYIDDPDYTAYMYALELLVYLQERRTHQVIIDLFSLPNDLPHALFGDLVTEGLPLVLLATCGGSVDRIVALLRDYDADEYGRSAAARALTHAVAEGVVPREDVIALFGALFTGTEADPDTEFWSWVASAAYDLYPQELMDVIEDAYERGLISEDIIDLDFFERGLATGSKAAAYEKLRQDRKRYMPRDIHERMSLWTMYDEEDAEP
jgi:hypothetical protein